MSSANAPPYETILKLCQQSGREPWYPAEFATSMGIDERKLKGPLDELQHAGLIESGQWEPRRGQGYRLTRAGGEALRSSRTMAMIRNGELPYNHAHSANEPAEHDSEPTASRGNAVLDALTSQARPYVTIALLATCFGLFLVGMSIAMAGNWAEVKVKWFLLGGNAHARQVTGQASAAAIEAGQWWRLLTSQFVHQDFFHLLICIGPLMRYGARAERMWGSWRLALIFVVSGLVGVCATLAYEPNWIPFGASGSACGVLLSMAVFYLLNRSQMPKEVANHGVRDVMLAFLWHVAFWIFLSWLGGAKVQWPTLAAGAAAGALIGAVLNYQRFMPIPINMLFLALVPLIPAAGIGAVAYKKNTEPFRQAAETQRKEMEKKKREAEENKKFNDEKTEFDRFNKGILPEVRKSEAFLEKDWPEVETLCETPAKDRKAAEVQEAKLKLKKGAEATDGALVAIDAAGKLEVDQVVDAVQAAKKYLQAQRKLIELAEQQLINEPDDDRSKTFAEQVEETKRMWRIFDKKLGK